MTTITIRHDVFTASGHAEFAERNSDIVCAATSAIIQNAVMGIIHVAKIAATVDKSDGKLVVTYPVDMTHAQQHDKKTLVATMILGLRDIARQFPNNVTLKEEN